MFDLNGNVIGINTALISPTGGNVGIGFAIPASRRRRSSMPCGAASACSAAISA
jgi:S1-C subfamily serine protease